MSMTLTLHDGLHYCPTDIYAVDTMPASRFLPAVRRVACPAPLPVPGKSRSHERFTPASKAKQVESEVWLLRLGSPGVHQLDMLPGRVTDTFGVDPLIPGHGQTMPRSVSFTRQHHLNVARESSWLS